MHFLKYHWDTTLFNLPFSGSSKLAFNIIPLPKPLVEDLPALNLTLFSILVFGWRALAFFFLFCCCCLVAQSCPTLWDPMDCSPPGSSVHGISQARVLEWVTYHALLQGIIPIQGLNLCLLHCRQILYCWATGDPGLSHSKPLSTVEDILNSFVKNKQTKKTKKPPRCYIASGFEFVVVSNSAKLY